MTDAWRPPSPGALDDTVWPERLVAKAVARGDNDDRLHGYDVLGDLAKHYSFSDLIYVALTGEVPTSTQSERFKLALFAAMPITVAEAPTHVALLGRIAGARFGAAVGAGLLALSDRFDHALTSETGQHDAWIETVLAATGDETSVTRGMTRSAVRLALLADAGISEPERIQAALTIAGSLGVIAEALLVGPKDLASYPVKLPPFHYIEPDRP